MLQNYGFDETGRQIQSSGNFFKYENGDNSAEDQTIVLRVDGQSLGEYLPGDSINLPFSGSLFEVMPVGPITGRVRVGMGQIVSNRMVMQGNIDTTQATEWVDRGNYFLGYVPGALANGGVSIRPNGKRVAVLAVNATRVCSLWLGTGGGTAIPAGTTGRNKMTSGSPSTALIGEAQLVGQNPTAGELTGGVQIATLQVGRYDMSAAPLILSGAAPLMMSASLALQPTFEWIEL